MKRKFFIASLIVIALFVAVVFPFSLMGSELSSTPVSELELREGDVIFQISQSNQSKYIQLATGSPLSHCGIIVKVGKEYKVLETLKTLKLTPLKTFINRGKGKKYWIKRSDKKNIKISYKKYLGRSYDLAFKPNNSRYYCSELVYDIYLKQLGIKLCDMNPINSYHTFGLDKIIRKRGMNPEQLVVAPSDIFDSEYLHSID